MIHSLRNVIRIHAEEARCVIQQFHQFFILPFQFVHHGLVGSSHSVSNRSVTLRHHYRHFIDSLRKSGVLLVDLVLLALQRVDHQIDHLVHITNPRFQQQFLPRIIGAHRFGILYHKRV